MACLLVTSGDYGRNILVVIEYDSKNIQEHRYKFKNIQGYLNDIFKFKNIWGSVRTLYIQYVPRSRQTNKAGSTIDAHAVVTMETS